LLLVGPSSVGKTAIAHELQRSLEGLWLIAGADMFWGMLKEERLAAGDFRTDSHHMRNITRGWHRAVAAIAAEGNSVIVDELGTHAWWLDDWHEVLHGMRWWSVLLTASPATLTKRETERGDRPPGLAASDLGAMPKRGRFNLVIDTDDSTVGESVAAIARLIA
jgi:chloramphenicol 3-O phosphotransferase